MRRLEMLQTVVDLAGFINLRQLSVTLRLECMFSVVQKSPIAVEHLQQINNIRGHVTLG